MRSWDGMMGLDWKSRSDDVQTEFQLIDSSENTGKEQTLSKAVQDFSSPAAVAVPRGLPLIRLHSILFSLLLPKPPSDLAILYTIYYILYYHLRLRVSNASC